MDYDKNSVVKMSGSPPFEYSIKYINDKGEEVQYQMAAVRKLPDKAKTTAEWLAYISIDMWMKGYELKEIGKRIDLIPSQIKANKKKARKK